MKRKISAVQQTAGITTAAQELGLHVGTSQSRDWEEQTGTVLI